MVAARRLARTEEGNGARGAGGRRERVPGCLQPSVWRSVLLGARATVSAKAAAGNLLSIARIEPDFPFCLATPRHATSPPRLASPRHECRPLAFATFFLSSFLSPAALAPREMHFRERSPRARPPAVVETARHFGLRVSIRAVRAMRACEKELNVERHRESSEMSWRASPLPSSTIDVTTFD